MSIEKIRFRQASVRQWWRAAVLSPIWQAAEADPDFDVKAVTRWLSAQVAVAAYQDGALLADDDNWREIRDQLVSPFQVLQHVPDQALRTGRSAGTSTRCSTRRSPRGPFPDRRACGSSSRSRSGRCNEFLGPLAPHTGRTTGRSRRSRSGSRTAGP